MRARLAFILLAPTLAACASGATEERNPQRSVGWILQQYGQARPDALELAEGMLQTKAIYHIHGEGPSRDLEDASIYDIGGFGSGDLWFRLQTSPCYPVEDAKQLLGADWTPRGERGFRYENARYVISVLADEERVDCVSLFLFLPVELATPRKPGARPIRPSLR